MKIFLLFLMMGQLRLSSCGNDYPFQNVENEEQNVDSGADSSLQQPGLPQDQEGGFYKSSSTFFNSIFYIMDISNPDSSICNSVKFEVNGIPAKLFNVRLDKKVGTVVHGNSSIWDADDDEDEECLYCIAYLKDGEAQIVDVIFKSSGLILQEHYKSRGSFFSRLGRRAWSPSKNKYAEKLNALRVSTDAPTMFLLDISFRRDARQFKLVMDEYDNAATFLYVPNVGHAIGAIVDEDSTIWKPEEGKTCLFAKLYCSNSSTLLLVAVNDGKYNYSERFEKKDGGWIEIAHQGFLDKIDRMSNRSYSLDSPPKQRLSSDYKIILDIENPNPRETDVYKRMDNELVYLAFTPNEEAFIYAVLDGGQQVWKAKGDEKCEHVAVHSKGVRTIIVLDVVNNGDFCALCFEKDESLWNVGNEGWKEISLEVSNEKIKAMQ